MVPTFLTILITRAAGVVHDSAYGVTTLASETKIHKVTC